MYVTILLGIFSVLFAYLTKYKNFQWGLKGSFFLIFLFLALRFEFGNDYKNYLDIFNIIKNYSGLVFFDNTIYGEPGWKFLNWLFKPFGFFAMTAFLALINCLIYYRLIEKYLPIKYYWLAVFIYIFSPGFMLTHLSAMRQSVSIGLFLFSLDYIYKKEAIHYFLLIGLASLFHTSALILLPVYLLSYTNRKINTATGILFFSFFVSLFMLQKYLLPYLIRFISSNFERYEFYQGAGTLGTGLGVLYLSALLILILYFEKFQTKDMAIIFKIAIISFLFIPIGLSLQSIGRVGMYFGPAIIIVYPVILMNLRSPVYKTIFISTLLFMTTYSFFQFFYSDIWKDAFGTYQSIFSAPEIY